MTSSRLYFLLFFILFSIGLSAQSNLLNAAVPQEVGQLNEQQANANLEAPIPYGYVDDRDVFWSRTIWEIVDLNERINFPYYYPTDTLNLGSNRRSLFDILKRGIRSKEITEVYKSSYFREKLSFDEIAETLVAIDTTDQGYDQYNAGEAVDPQFITRRNITAAEIEQYRIKGTWYFDKRIGEMKYRILGIAPVAPDVNFLDGSPEEQDLVELFWVWYPNARIPLNNMKVFNSKNSSQQISFDHMLNSRRFSGLIYREENVYEDRQIKDYIYEDALRQLLESERIKTLIRDFELDMWNN